MNMKNRNGMTLVELMTYIALAALLIAPVMMLMRNSSVNMTRDSANVDLRITGRDILSILFDDIRNTGFKVKNIAGASWADKIEVANVTNIAAALPDSSSFTPIDSVAAFDGLTVRKGVLNASGGWMGFDIISYWVDVPTGASLGELKRRVNKSYAGTEGPVVIAKNVEALQFMYSSDMYDWVDGDYFDDIGTNAASMAYKKEVKYVKIFIVLRDDRSHAAASATAAAIIGSNDSTGVSTDWDVNWTVGPSTSPILRERFEIVVPMPNNGLFPWSL